MRPVLLKNSRKDFLCGYNRYKTKGYARRIPLCYKQNQLKNLLSESVYPMLCRMETLLFRFNNIYET